MAKQRPHDEEKVRKLQEMLGYPVTPKRAEPVPQADVENGDLPPEEPPVDAGSGGDGENPPEKAPKKFKFEKEKFLRALWTIASTVSMIVTIVVLIVVMFLFKYVRTYAQYFPLKETMALLEKKGEDLPPDLDVEQVAAITKKTVETFPADVGLNTPLDLLQGLYENFEKMDNAHIKTEITVQDEIPVEFTLGIQQKTTVVLSEPVTISGARVTVSTGGLNIYNAPATVVLPAGTNLPIILNLDVPVDKMVPVELHVPVDIALNQTDLHEPFVGLQGVVEPLYCLIKSDATNAKGEAICLKEAGE